MSFMSLVRSNLLRGFLGLFLIGSLLGCGGSDSPDLHHVSGSVTFNGKPVPNGLIRFTPDGSKGNSGPAGYAVIKDGKYDTAQDGGKGHVSGAMVILIEGSEALPANQDGEEKDIKLLFSGYQTTAELPQEDSTKDFDVPAAAGKRKDAPETNRGNPNDP